MYFLFTASLSSASTPIGCIFSGYLMDRIGRKKVLLFTEIPVILGWLCIAMATDIKMIYIGRLLVGFGSGMVGAPARQVFYLLNNSIFLFILSSINSRVYTAEVTQPHLRGMLGALASVGISFGILFQYTLGKKYLLIKSTV